MFVIFFIDTCDRKRKKKFVLRRFIIFKFSTSRRVFFTVKDKATFEAMETRRVNNNGDAVNLVRREHD